MTIPAPSIKDAAAFVVAERYQKHATRARVLAIELQYVEATEIATDDSAIAISKQALRDSLAAELAYHQGEAERFDAAFEQIQKG